MPSRTASLAIVLFWLFTAGWYFHREIWPHMAADAPPPYVIDLADEALRQVVPVRWVLYRNHERIAPVRTIIEYRDRDDSFQLECMLMSECEIAKVGDFRINLVSFHDHYRVNRAGELLGTDTDLAFTAAGVQCRLQIHAEIKNGLAKLATRFTYPGGEIAPDLEPVAIGRGGVLNPMHPVHRIVGLKPGMRWRMPLMDPLSDVQKFALEGLFRSVVGDKVKPPTIALPRRTLTAQVTGPIDMEWNGKTVACYVIEYRGDDYSAQTWVRISDSAVLRQQANASGDEFVLERE